MPKTVTFDIEPRLIDRLENIGYTHLVKIDGKVCGLLKFLFTVAIVVDIDYVGYAYRYCYSDYDAAATAIGNWILNDDEEPKGYIKRKPET